jgi:hypothetical protein
MTPVVGARNRLSNGSRYTSGPLTLAVLPLAPAVQNAPKYQNSILYP